MMSIASKRQAILGVECGATKSTAVLRFTSNGSGQILELGPANFILLGYAGLERFFQALHRAIVEKFEDAEIVRIGIGMSGVLKNEDKQTVQRIVQNHWPNLEQIWIGNDLESALACLNGDSATPKLIVIAGTGSCCYGANGVLTSRIGGCGHVIGDAGSGYAIAHSALRAAVREFELTGKSNLLESLMTALNVNSLDDLATKTLAPDFTKAQMSSLAPIVLAAWNSGNATASIAVNKALDELAEDAACLARKLATENLGIKIGLAGSLLTESELYRAEFQLKLRTKMGTHKINFEVLRQTFYGALAQISENSDRKDQVTVPEPFESHGILLEKEMRELVLPIRTALSPTECRNPRSTGLDKMSVSGAIDLWISEESTIFAKISEQKAILERIITRLTKTFQNGGRLFYAGAGTSGRLGVLDASECPPTFQSPPTWVQGIIAGGDEAIANSREAAEDSVVGGMEAVDEHKINSSDILMGIASSGTTPFVWGALHRAKSLGAFTIFLTFNPNLKLKLELDEVLTVNVGPEILTGSTRLKCGTATKIILNMITTLAMVQYGKCYENLMVDLDPACEKLRERALRIVLTLVSGLDENTAERVLISNKYAIKKTVDQLKREH